MEERKIYTLKKLYEGLENSLFDMPKAKICLHNKKSYSTETVFSEFIIPLNKALKIFGDCEIIYPQISLYGEHNDIPCIKFGIVVED